MISYKKRRKYKYTLSNDYSYQTDIKVPEDIDLGLLRLKASGLLHFNFKKGYAWDGASGPAFDTKNIMRGSLVHDALYQLMREEKIGQDQRLKADKILKEICLEAGMSKLRAWWVFQGVRIFGVNGAKPDTLHAP
jgi:hypothetical protein